MDEIKKTLTILKTRWPEAALIVGLGFLPELLSRIFRIYQAIRVFSWFVVVGLAIITIILSAGFLRTIYLEQDKRQSLPDLMRTGRHFFWRILAVYLLLGFAMMLFVWLLGKTVIAMDLGTTFPLANRVGITLITLLLAKLTLLIPAIIIVLDCRLSKSFGLMWKVKLFKAKPLLVIYLISVVVLPYLWLLFPNFRGSQPAISWGYTFSILDSIMLRFLTLMVQVMAVRFIISLGIDCAEPYEPPESFKLTGIV